MKILLDECIDVRLKSDFHDLNVFTVRDMNWLGKSNGELLSLITEHNFDVLVTIDKRLRFQQNLSKYKIAVVVLDVKGGTLSNLRKILPLLIEKLPSIKPYEVTTLSINK